jgi:hypothetical protein
MVVVGGALGDGFGTVLAASWPILENPEGRPHRGVESMSPVGEKRQMNSLEGGIG